MKDLKKILDPSEFRTDEDFGDFVADMEECKETGQKFYLCKERNLKKMIDHEQKRSFNRGLIVGVIAYATGVIVSAFLPDIKEGVSGLRERFRK